MTRITTAAGRAGTLDFDRPAAEKWARFQGPVARLAYEVAVLRSNGAAWKDVRWYMAGTDRERLVRACAMARTLPTRFPKGGVA